MSFLVVWGSLRWDANVTGYLPNAKLAYIKRKLRRSTILETAIKVLTKS